MVDILAQREVFHIAFLRQLATVVRPGGYALKGGVNLRLFFGSRRYSEDMDIDVSGVEVFRLKEIVMRILKSVTLATSLKSFGIDKIVPPNIKAAKQTETTQRFKVHLITSSSNDLFTKIEFSRRGFDAAPVTETIDMSILRTYKLPPLLVSHYPAGAAVVQKIRALAGRKKTEARDVFDLYTLTSFTSEVQTGLHLGGENPKDIAEKTRERVLDVSFETFRDTVLNYLDEDDRRAYDQKEVWDEIKLKVVEAIETLL